MMELSIFKLNIYKFREQGDSTHVQTEKQRYLSHCCSDNDLYGYEYDIL